MSKATRVTFIVHAVVALLFGLALLAAPGRSLGIVGWAPVDPVLTRVLGAALLALAWSSFRAFRAAERQQVALLIELEAVFCALACAGLLRQIGGSHYPAYVWALFAVFAAFAIAWIVALVRKYEKPARTADEVL